MKTLMLGRWGGIAWSVICAGVVCVALLGSSSARLRTAVGGVLPPCDAATSYHDPRRDSSECIARGGAKFNEILSRIFDGGPACRRPFARQAHRKMARYRRSGQSTTAAHAAIGSQSPQIA